MKSLAYLSDTQQKRGLLGEAIAGTIGDCFALTHFSVLGISQASVADCRNISGPIVRRYTVVLGWGKKQSYAKIDEVDTTLKSKKIEFSKFFFY